MKKSRCRSNKHILLQAVLPQPLIDTLRNTNHPQLLSHHIWGQPHAEHTEQQPSNFHIQSGHDLHYPDTPCHKENTSGACTYRPPDRPPKQQCCQLFDARSTARQDGHGHGHGQTGQHKQYAWQASDSLHLKALEVGSDAVPCGLHHRPHLHVRRRAPALGWQRASTGRHQVRAPQDDAVHPNYMATLQQAIEVIPPSSCRVAYGEGCLNTPYKSFRRCSHVKGRSTAWAYRSSSDKHQGEALDARSITTLPWYLSLKRTQRQVRPVRRIKTLPIDGLVIHPPHHSVPPTWDHKASMPRDGCGVQHVP